MSGDSNWVGELRTLDSGAGFPHRRRARRSRWVHILFLTLCGVLVLGGLAFVGLRWLQQRTTYAPISEKSRWTYALEIRGPFGDVQKGKMVIRVDGTETINGKTYYKVVTVFSGVPGAEPTVEYRRASQDGTYSIDGKHKDKPERLVSPASLAVGTTWTETDPKGERTEYRVEGVETAELFDRKYENCLKISYQGTTREIFTSKIAGYEYHAPGIGLVKGVFVNGLMTIEVTLETYEK